MTAKRPELRTMDVPAGETPPPAPATKKARLEITDEIRSAIAATRGGHTNLTDDQCSTLWQCMSPRQREEAMAKIAPAKASKKEADSKDGD